MMGRIQDDLDADKSISILIYLEKIIRAKSRNNKLIIGSFFLAINN